MRERREGDSMYSLTSLHSGAREADMVHDIW